MISDFPKFTLPIIMFSHSKDIPKKNCKRYYFWKPIARIDGKGNFAPGPPKKTCRKFLEDRGEIILNETRNYIDTVTIEQMKNLKI